MKPNRIEEHRKKVERERKTEDQIRKKGRDSEGRIGRLSPSVFAKVNLSVSFYLLRG
jgi:hypothetical protein